MSESIVCNKSFEFAVAVVKLCRNHSDVLAKQLVRSATSIGANCREVVNAESKADFIHKLGIAQKECGESIYWLELFIETEYVKKEDGVIFLNQAKELMRIIRSIIISSRRNASQPSGNS